MSAFSPIRYILLLLLLCVLSATPGLKGARRCRASTTFPCQGEAIYSCCIIGGAAVRPAQAAKLVEGTVSAHLRNWLLHEHRKMDAGSATGPGTCEDFIGWLGSPAGRGAFFCGPQGMAAREHGVCDSSCGCFSYLW